MNMFWQRWDVRLTGRVRYRSTNERLGFWKREPVMVAQVEEEYRCGNVLDDPAKAKTARQWRDMRVSDLKFLPPNSNDEAVA